MTSQINPNNIDGSYPVAGQDNNSQGFRDNFTNTKVNFQYAVDEINDLQNKAVLKAALTGTTLDNNMANALIYAAKVQAFSATKVSVSGTSGSISINYGSGHYQSITTSGSITLAFPTANWPPTGTYGYLKLQINITNIAHTVTLPASVTLGTVGLQGYSAGTITFGATGVYEFGFGSYDAGTTVTIFDLNRALTNFTAADLQIDDLTATGSASITGNVQAGNLRTVGSVSATGNVTGGNVLFGSGIVSGTGNITGGNVLVGAGQVSGTGNVTGGNVIGFSRPSAGSASQAPILLTSGTNLSVVTAGAIEYDGSVFYNTNTSTSRGLLPSSQIIALVSDYVANDSSSAQKVFNSPTNGTVAVSASTTYEFEAQYVITRSVGSNSHTLSTLFALGGGASLTSITYTAETTSTASNTLGAVSRIYGTAATALVVTGASTATNEVITVKLRGIMRVNAGGTLTPQIQYDAAPGGSPTIVKNSFFKLTALGTGSVGSIGTWT